MQVMREMAKEMTKMGLIEEMMEETFDSLEPEDMEELAQVSNQSIITSFETRVNLGRGGPRLVGSHRRRTGQSTGRSFRRLGAEKGGKGEGNRHCGRVYCNPADGAL
jgi:hypothetical protein